MSTTQLNPDQQQALARVTSFMRSNDKEFFLTGGPGVGKTFTTRRIAEDIPTLMNNYHNALGTGSSFDMEVVLTSTTNKAAAVLSSETNKMASTIHFFLGVVPKQNYSTGKTNLTKNGRWKVHSNKLIIIDESPLNGAKMHNLIHEATDPSCKIIHIGDKNQLAPVMEKESPITQLTRDPDTHYTITTPVRNSGSKSLMDLCDRLRQDVENETDRDHLTHWAQAPDIEWLDGPQLQAVINEKFGPGGEVRPDDPNLKGRILCYTNGSAVGYNRYIREIRGLPLHPVAGETLIANQHIKVSRSVSINVEDEVTVKKVLGLEQVGITNDIILDGYRLEVSTPWAGTTEILVPEDINRYHSALKLLKRNQDWIPMYALKDTFADLRDRDSSTVYKAQGSTYDFVVMIMNDIFSSRDPSQLRRMLYVAASRAKKKVFVYDPNIHNRPRRIYT